MVRFRQEIGFTLIELMLVSAIIGFLAAIAIPKMANLIDKAREAAIKGQLGVLRSALALYYVDNEGLYPKYHNATPMTTRGIFHLHGKYVDLNTITFKLPGYIGGGVYRAMGYYEPLLTSMIYNNVTFSPDSPVPVHAYSPIPSYWNYITPNSLNGVPVQATIRTYCASLTGPPGTIAIDTKGQEWSSW